MSKTVCVSLKELYLENGAFLTNGGYIDFYSDEDNEYYDLRTDDVEKIVISGKEYHLKQSNFHICYLERLQTEIF